MSTTSSSTHIADEKDHSSDLAANPTPLKSAERQAVDPEKAPAAIDDTSDNDKPVNPWDPAAFPDGGLEAWLVVSGAFACLFCSFGWINAIGVFQAYYETHQLKEYSPSDIAWIPSLETFMMFAGGPICGKIFDNYGPRWLLLIGAFLNVFGIMMTSLWYESLAYPIEGEARALR